MKKGKIKLFVDFDGTITEKDVGNGIFERFLRPELLERNWHEEVIGEWKAGRLSSLDCLTQECRNSVVTAEELNEELDNYTLTPGFTETAAYCAENDIDLMILSDGLDYYIEYILGKFGLDGIPFRANHMYFNDGALGVEFPHSVQGCGKCGNCKRWHIDRLRSDGDSIVYVGDGYSDRYAIRSSDIVFARGDLAGYCRENDLSFNPFKTFFDVLDYLRNGGSDV